MNDTYHGASGQIAALYFLEILSLLHEQLQGYADAPFGALTQIRMERFPTTALENVYSSTYRSLIVDYSPADVRKKVKTVVLEADVAIAKRPFVNSVLPPVNNGLFDIPLK